MHPVDLSFWQVGELLLRTHGAGDYRVFREPNGTYACEMREHPSGCWQCFAEGYELAAEAVEACAADLRERTGGAL